MGEVIITHVFEQIGHPLDVLFDAALIGLIGGVLGVLFGYLLSSILPAMMGSAGGIMSKMSEAGTVVSMNSVFLGLGVSMFIGIAAGVIPAYQASKLRPVDALRHE